MTTPTSHAAPLSIIPLRGIRSLSVLAVFLALAVGLPTLAHQLAPAAGPVFLPMHFVVLAGALLFGWRFGFMLGLLSPVASYALTALPPAPILGPMTAELATYGLVAGYLRERTRLPLFLSLVGALVLGRVALGLWYLFDQPLTEVSTRLWQSARTGWPGLLLQLAILSWLPAAIRGWMNRPDADDPTTPPRPLA